MTLGCVKWVSRTLLYGCQVVLSGFQHVAMWLLRSSGWLFTDPCQKCQLSSLYDSLVYKFVSAFSFNASSPFFFLFFFASFYQVKISLVSYQRQKTEALAFSTSHVIQGIILVCRTECKTWKSNPPCIPSKCSHWDFQLNK